MKLVKTITLGLALVTTMLFVGCVGNSAPDSAKVAKKIDDSELGFRSNLFSEDGVTPDMTNYSSTEAGMGTPIDRAFQDAPPMISHTVEGMLPIKIDNNQCLTCHIPGVAEELNTLPYPKSHMIDFRPKDTLVGDRFNQAADIMKNEVVMADIGTLSNSRFNCNGCHAPQSEGQLVENSFVADFVSKDGKSRSDWVGTRIVEGINSLE